ncbi:uncharacterized protein UTRI_02716 [Ustilago trichophora]|uniref:Uncharacterized protein n=1 Tax=Ustilago trichophora TaxID=86804 RepID=A0A5C3ES26_9BASI|nr:uncharacterized protein UTRI_02716 [Ustilago trichophora]
MNSDGPAGAGRGRPSHARGHRPHRGGRGGDRGRGRGGGGGGGGRGGYAGHRGGRGGRGGGHSHRIPPAPLGDPSLDPQLAPKPPHPGYFHTSFLENPWYDLEKKLDIPHLKPIISTQEVQSRADADHAEALPEEPSAAPQEAAVATEPSPP